MTEAGFQVLKAAGFAAAVAVALALQRARPHSAAVRARGSNLALFALNAGITGLLCGGCACTVARWAAHGGFGVFRLLALPSAANWVASVLFLDLVSYGWYRANHRVVLLWSFHQVHHSDSTFSVSTALRFHPGELLLSLPLRLAAVAVLGADAAAVIVFEVLFGFANLFEHGDIDLPAGMERALGRIGVTPALHRLHHSRRIGEMNSNFGTIFTLWDRGFGTFRENSSGVIVDTGLPGVAATPPLGVALAMPLHGAGPIR